MATTEKYTTVIELNSEQAKRNLDELRKKVESWKSDLAEAKANKMGKSFITSIQKELRAAEKELKKYDTEVARTVDTMNNLQSASVKNIEAAQKSLKRLAAEVPRDSEFSKNLNAQLDMVTQELENIKATKAFEQLQRDATGATKALELTKAEAEFVNQTVANIDTASLKQLKMAEQSARNIKESTAQGSDEYKAASTNLNAIQTKLSDIDAKERKIVTLTDQYNNAMKAVGKDTMVVKNETQLIERTLDNLSTASVRDIEFSIKALKDQLKDTVRSDAEIEKITDKIKKLNAELRKVQDMQNHDGSKKGLFSRMWDGLNKNWGAFTQVLLMYSGLRNVIRGSVEDFAEMDQAMANVRKYTGQTTEAVVLMNEDFKRMDTRTPREQLNELAGAAGRLGITSSAAVEEFVDAADKIGVALGDDLGDGAVDKIGKLAMAFGEDEKKGLRGAMLATGSAVNELAQSSSAQAGYLVEFAARLSGVGMQAGLTQSQILGFGAVMDENMQKDEMAATALSQIITKMTTDSATFARIAGANVEEFSNLVKNDMNAALMQFFEAMNKKGGFTELAPLFEQMGLDGTRAIGVLSTLSSKINDVRKHQENATEAYEKGTSVIDEFNIQNETYQAKLDKARKAFAELRIELGQKLLPVASVAISTTSLTVEVLNTLINFVTKYGTTLAVLTVSIGLATAAIEWDSVVKKKNAVVTKLVSFWNDTLRASLKKLYALVMANPWAAAAAGAAILVGVIADLTRRSREATVAQKAMADVEHDAMVKAEIQKNKIEQLTQKIHDNSLSIDERRGYIEELQEIVPDYVAKISEEGRVYEESTEALDNYIKKIKEKAMIDGAKSKIEELAAERAELVAEKMRLNEEIQRRKEEEANRRKTMSNSPQTSSGAVAPSGVHAAMGASAEIAANKSRINEIDDKITETENAIELLGKVAKNSAKTVANTTDTKYTDNKSNYDTRSYWEAELKARREKLKEMREDAKSTAAEIEKADQAVKEAESKMETFTGAKAAARSASAASHAERDDERDRRERLRQANDAEKAATEQMIAELTHRYAMGEIVYSEYVKKQQDIQLDDLDRRMLIYEKDSLEFQKLNRKKEELLLNGSEESRKLSLANMKHEHEQRLAALEELAWRENMTEQQKNEIIFREDMRFMDEQRILYRKGTLERIDLENDIEAEQQQHRLQTEQYYQQQLDQVREQYLNQSDEKVKDLAMQHIDELHERKLLSEEEFHEALLALDAQYANYESNSEHDQRVGANAYKVAQNSAKQDVDASGSKSANLPIMGDIMLYKSTMEQLKQMYKSDEITHAEYLAAKSQATAQFCEGLAQKFQAAYQSVNQIMSAASSYFSAQQEYETTMVQKKYEKQIAAAGNNQAKVKKLQEKQQKEEAAIKTKYARKQAAIQVAQAIAGTAMSAIQAYASAAAVPVVGYILAPIAAAAALAAGMLQVATIKKQQKAQEAGYYEGGFTGGRQYRREAGVVHEGEFVANHRAVQNPAVLPVLNFLDQAQRNNTIGSLTARDVSRSVGMPATTQVVAPVVNVQTDNDELRDAIQAQQAATAALLDRLSEPIEAQMVMHDFDRDYKRYQNLMKNK